ncbi:MAG: hypothetical protein QXO03_02800 [Thermoplasmatales archaeon]
MKDEDDLYEQYRYEKYHECNLSDYGADCMELGLWMCLEHSIRLPLGRRVDIITSRMNEE